MNSPHESARSGAPPARRGDTDTAPPSGCTGPPNRARARPGAVRRARRRRRGGPGGARTAWSLACVVGGVLLRLGRRGAAHRRAPPQPGRLPLLLGAFQLWQQGWLRAVESVGDLLALVLLATVVTMTTPVDAMVDTMTRALRPFRRVGVDPEAVALAFSLTLRAIPATVEIAEETRQAAPRPRPRAQPAGAADADGDPGRRPRQDHRRSAARAWRGRRLGEDAVGPSAPIPMEA